MSDRIARWGGIAALVFVALIVVSIASGGSPPAADDAADKIRTYFIDHRGGLLLGNICGLVATPFVILFFVALRHVLRGDDETNLLGGAALAGIIVTAPMAMVGGAISAAPVYVDGVADKLSDDTLRLAFEAQQLMFAATSSGILLLSITTALAIKRSGALPAYTMWLALLAAAGNIVALCSTIGAGASVLGFFGIGTFALFLLVTGITMATGRATPASAAT